MNEPKQEEGYHYITPDKFKEFEPKLATDELYIFRNVWVAVGNSSFKEFDSGTTYRRKINPAVVEKCPICNGQKHLGNPDYHCPVCGGTGTLRPHLKDKPVNLGLENIIRNQSEIIGKLKSALTEISKNIGSTHAAELAAKTLKEVE